MSQTAEHLREQLRTVLTTIETRFGHQPKVIDEGWISVDLAAPGTVYSWTRQAEVGFDGDRVAADAELRAIASDYTGQDWRATDRSTPGEAVLQLSRDGFDVGISTSRDGHRVVVGGSTPVVPAAEVPTG